jgi:cell filamentation protein
MSSKYGDDRDPYLYPALNVMRNRLGIRQAQRLEQTAWKSPPCVRRRCRWDRGRGLPYLCFIHHQLYQDIFDWAIQRSRYLSGRYPFLPFCVD